MLYIITYIIVVALTTYFIYTLKHKQVLIDKLNADLVESDELRDKMRKLNTDLCNSRDQLELERDRFKFEYDDYKFRCKILERELEECKHTIDVKDSHLDDLIEDKFMFKEKAEKLEAENKYLLESIFELHKSNTEETFERIMRSIVFKETGEQAPVKEESVEPDDLTCLERCYEQLLWEAGEDDTQTT